MEHGWASKRNLGLCGFLNMVLIFTLNALSLYRKCEPDLAIDD